MKKEANDITPLPNTKEIPKEPNTTQPTKEPITLPPSTPITNKTEN